MPYEVPFAGKEAYETIVSASKGKLEIIANENIQTKEQVEELFKLGIHKVCTTKAYEILKIVEKRKKNERIDSKRISGLF